jgi:hypothetical protein
LEEDNTPLEPFREVDVTKAIKKLNPNKSSDEYGLAAASYFASDISSPAIRGNSPFINPNCNSVSFTKFNFSRRLFSKVFPITAVTVMPL